MLSGAKHLQYLLENKQMQILRSAQDDSPFESFIPPVNCYLRVKRRVKLIKNARTIPREN